MRMYEMDVSALTPDGIALLPLERRKQAERYRFEKDRLLCLTAGVLLYRGLAEYGLSENQSSIACGADGKPFLPNAPWLHFSLSHSGTRALAVFSENEIGCDLERLRPVSWPVAEKCFCPEELETLRCSSQPEIDFCRIWTCKESFLKAIGTGLRTPLRAACIHLSPNRAAITQCIDPRRWTLTEFSREGYCMAVCEEVT